MANHERHRLARVDVTDARAESDAFGNFRPTAEMHLAAVSHVDRSIIEFSYFI